MTLIKRVVSIERDTRSQWVISEKSVVYFMAIPIYRSVVNYSRSQLKHLDVS